MCGASLRAMVRILEIKMALKMIIVATALISVTVSASVQHCCRESEDYLNTHDILCGTEENMAKMIGDDFSGQVVLSFGISKKSLKLPIYSESGSKKTNVVKNLQNSGFVITPRSNMKVRVVIPALTRKSSESGAECSAVKFSNLDNSYNTLRELIGIDTREVSAPNGACLVSIKDIDSILKTSFIRQLRTSYLKRGIFLLPPGKSNKAQVNISVRAGGLTYANDQFDINYSTKKSSNGQDILGTTDAKIDFDYGVYGIYTSNLNKQYTVTRVTNNDQLDYAVLQKRIFDGLNISRCNKVRR